MQNNIYIDGQNIHPNPVKLNLTKPNKEKLIEFLYKNNCIDENISLKFYNRIRKFIFSNDINI